MCRGSFSHFMMIMVIMIIIVLVSNQSIDTKKSIIRMLIGNRNVRTSHLDQTINKALSKEIHAFNQNKVISYVILAKLRQTPLSNVFLSAHVTV